MEAESDKDFDYDRYKRLLAEATIRPDSAVKNQRPLRLVVGPNGWWLCDRRELTRRAILMWATPLPRFDTGSTVERPAA